MSPLCGDPPGFGNQSLRKCRTLWERCEFFYQTVFRTVQQVSRREDGLNKVFIAEFAFMSTTPAYCSRTVLERQPGLWRGLAHVPGWAWKTPRPVFRSTSSIPRRRWRVRRAPWPAAYAQRPHRIRFWIKTNRGIDNDLVRISVDGVDLGQCFTTWEN